MGEKWPMNFSLKMPDFHLGIFYVPVNLRNGTDGFTSLSEGRRAEDFCFFALKNPTASVGFEPGNLGTKGPTRLSLDHRSR
jgi:hypothetical protein